MAPFGEVCGRAGCMASGRLERSRRAAQFSWPPAQGRMRPLSDRTATDLEREPAMLTFVRDCLRASECDDLRIPTTAVDQVLDELSSLARSPRVPN